MPEPMTPPTTIITVVKRPKEGRSPRGGERTWLPEGNRSMEGCISDEAPGLGNLNWLTRETQSFLANLVGNPELGVSSKAIEDRGDEREKTAGFCTQQD